MDRPTVPGRPCAGNTTPPLFFFPFPPRPGGQDTKRTDGVGRGFTGCEALGFCRADADGPHGRWLACPSRELKRGPRARAASWARRRLPLARAFDDYIYEARPAHSAGLTRGGRRADMGPREHEGWEAWLAGCRTASLHDPSAGEQGSGMGRIAAAGAASPMASQPYQASEADCRIPGCVWRENGRTSGLPTGRCETRGRGTTAEEPRGGRVGTSARAGGKGTKTRKKPCCKVRLQRCA